jgi:hypothetical protein
MYQFIDQIKFFGIKWLLDKVNLLGAFLELKTQKPKL